MPFSAINTYEQELKQRNERHTLELQLEQAMSIYQSALEAQSSNDFSTAYDGYNKLFAFEVLKPQKLASKNDSTRKGDPKSISSAAKEQLGPAIRLRAMALKNFALLLLDQPNVDPETVNSALGFFGEALDLVGCDDPEQVVLPSMVPVFYALGFTQMARLSLEILVQNAGSGALEPLKTWRENKNVAMRHFGPRTIEFLACLDFINQEGSSVMRPKMLEKYSNLVTLASGEPSLPHVLENESSAVVSLTAKSWRNLIVSINEVLNSASRRTKRRNNIKDTYAWSHRDIWDIEIQGILFNRSTEAQQATPVQSPVHTPPHSPHPNQDEDRVESDAAEEEDGEKNKPQDIAADGENKPVNVPGTPPRASPVAAASPGLRSPVVASPAKRRRTDRAKRSTVTLPADFGVLDGNFVSQFNAYLALAAPGTAFYSPAFLFLDPNQEPSPALIGAAEFRDLLVGWDNRDSSQLLMKAASARPQKGGIMTTLRRGNVSSGDVSPGADDEDDIDDPSEDPAEESLDVDAFVSSHKHLHIQQLRWELANHLLSRLVSGGHGHKFASVVYNYIDDIESMLYSRRNFLSSDMVRTIYGLYSDHWIQKKSQDDELKLHRWKLVSSQYPCLEHAWITAFVDQESDVASPELSIAQFMDILNHMTAEVDERSYLFSHLKEIPALTIANTQMQISKFKAASAFERVLIPASSKQPTSNEEDISLLQAMLMPENHKKPDWISDSEFEAILNFLGNAQPQFKMGLWYLLLEKYEASGSASDSLTGLTKIFMEAQAAFRNGEALTSTLSVCHDVGKRLVGLLERTPDMLFTELEVEEARLVLLEIIRLNQTLHLFLLYDEAVNSNLMQKPVTPSWTEASNKLRELVVMWWTLFYRFWLQCIDNKYLQAPETANDILSIIHERLGHLGYCGLADGCLLNLHISEICRLNWNGSALDICQCMKCKFGFNLTLYGDIANHHTMAVPLSLDDARTVLPLIMNLVLHHRSYNQIVMRMDIRNAIDEFANVLNVRESPQHQSRVQHLNEFLSSDFTPEILIQTWHGLQANMLGYSESDDCCSIWTVQAHVILTQYRMRRRQSYGAISVKTESLNAVIELFIYDLASRPTRFESWVGLTYAYLYLTEDCLTFGDESTVPNEPDLYCRQALLTISQAIALQVGNKQGSVEISVAQPDTAEALSSTVWSILGNLLMLAVMPPLMSKSFALMDRPFRPLLVQSTSDSTSYRLGTVQPRVIGDKVALKLAIRCLSQPNENNQDWINAMHQTQAALKLGLSPDVTIDFARRALDINVGAARSPEVEYLNVIWVSYRGKNISESDARKALGHLAEKLKNVAVDETTNVIQFIQERLRKLANSDKWLHRPRYLLSQIELLEYNNTVAAQEEILHLFSLKSPTKPLVIWNTEDNLPGGHSVAMSVYVRYLADLMFKNQDNQGLLLLVRRFRRTAGEMWMHSQTCDYIHGKACELVRKKLDLDHQKNKYGDTLISEVSNQEEYDFTETVKAMSDADKSSFNENDPWVQLLFYVLELRKAHTGLKALAIADELVISVFLTIFKMFVKKNPRNGSGPDGLQVVIMNPENNNDSAPKKEKPRAKKIIRKDVVSAAQQFMRQFQAAFSKVDNARIPDAEFKLAS